MSTKGKSARSDKHKKQFYSRQRIMRVAEYLFATNGINGVSLRHICEEAGQKNKCAVQYHFQNKRGLIDAIFAERSQQMEEHRQELLIVLTKDGKPLDTRALLSVIYLPLVKLTDHEGRLTYARLLLQFLTQFTPWPDINLPMDQSQAAPPVLVKMTAQLSTLLQFLPPGLLRIRQMQIARMFIGALVEWENAVAHGEFALPLEVLIDDLLNMCAHALEAPVGSGVAEKLRTATLSANAHVSDRSKHKSTRAYRV